MLVYEREHRSEALLIALNFSEGAATPLPGATPLLLSTDPARGGEIFDGRLRPHEGVVLDRAR
jgi:hypothetical protein